MLAFAKKPLQTLTQRGIIFFVIAKSFSNIINFLKKEEEGGKFYYEIKKDY